MFINGPHGSFTTVTGNCAPVYLEFELAPLAAFGVLGMPLDRLPDQPLDLVDVLGAEGRRVGEKVRSVESWRQRFALVDTFLLNRLDRAPRLAPEVVRAWSLLKEGRGQTQVSDLAEDVGWSHKHLITKFREQLGLPPKTAARLIRFGHVRQLLADGQFGLARIAAEAGFSDQPHLTREIRKFTGNTPSEFLRATGVVNSLQDARERPQ